MDEDEGLDEAEVFIRLDESEFLRTRLHLHVLVFVEVD